MISYYRIRCSKRLRNFLLPSLLKVGMATLNIKISIGSSAKLGIGIDSFLLLCCQIRVTDGIVLER